MRHNDRLRETVATGLILLFFAVLVAGIFYPATARPQTLAAQRGVLDLRGWDFARQGSVQLNGEWTFYQGQMRTTLEEGGGSVAEQPIYTEVPGTWNGGSGAGDLPSKGSGTYRLLVRLPESGLELGLQVPSIRMAHRLYVNGRLEGGSGVPATGPDAFEPGNTPYDAYFYAREDQLEVVVQVANYNFMNGGIVGGLTLGLTERIAEQTNWRLGLDIGLLLLLILFGIYQLGLYVLDRNDKGDLYSGLFMLLLALYHALYHEKVAQRLLPEAPFELMYKLMEASQFGSQIVYMLFIAAVAPAVMPRRLVQLLLLPFYGYLATVLILPYGMHTAFKYPFVAYQMLLSLVMLGRMVEQLVRAPRAKIDETGRRREQQELILLLGAATALLVYLVNTSMYSENLLHSQLGTRVGIVGFVACAVILLARRHFHAYAEARRLSAALMQANELKDELLLRTSHELKTPLHGMTNMASAMLQDETGELSARQRQRLWLIQDTSTKLSMLVRDLIDLARLKHDDLQLHSTAVDAAVAADIVLELLRFELSGKPVRLHNAIAPGTHVQADENRLRQILYNLVHNAIKHTREGSVVLRAADRDGRITLYVADTGEGIAPGRREAVFAYLEREHGHRAADGYPGMGVGLYISRMLAQRMHGSLAVEWSEPGIGTRMALTLPGAAVAASPPKVELFRPRRQAREHPLPLELVEGEEAATILVVDDEPSNLYVLLALLHAQPYNVVTALSVREAMAKLKTSGRIDLVIVDVMMPDGSGLDLCRSLRQQYSLVDLPILIATVKDAPEDIALGFRAGANDYVTKPFQGEALLARIHNLLELQAHFRDAVRHELAFHQAQIKPHFLYNALSSVISFCYTDGDKAAYLLTMLSQYLRYLLEVDHTEAVATLERELLLIEAYVEIEQARFGDRIDYWSDIESGLEGALVPPLCLQPFVENAIRHGLFDKEGAGTVSLVIRKRGAEMEVKIADDGAGIPPSRLQRILAGERDAGSLGIANIRKRLETLPGSSLSIRSELGRGTTVTLMIPLEKGMGGLRVV
ncbi:response regulator [Paenibacillus sp. IB182496]|uniref:histidine kinase n=1 Tax=Paenibacillus sabuli TaxID=2772509 RepID=A0A927GT30_9BACL|nr:ATP-binding protein [Paenibacillus sabuli]MBD2846660.1 response regulator [Paenibacillus sabuli]